MFNKKLNFNKRMNLKSDNKISRQVDKVGQWINQLVKNSLDLAKEIKKVYKFLDLKIKDSIKVQVYHFRLILIEKVENLKEKIKIKV